uniref:Cytochrome P450 n=1 Tax=Brassica oleracea var. oleracea TaxID=109376 RepID=A0A0D3AQF7_BRAOL
MLVGAGSARFVITSEPETAKELLNSSAFADMPVKESAYELLFHRSMGFAPFGDYWRELRRISSTHLFSPKRVSGFASPVEKSGIVWEKISTAQWRVMERWRSEESTTRKQRATVRGSPPSVYSEELSDDLVVLGVSSEILFFGIPFGNFRGISEELFSRTFFVVILHFGSVNNVMSIVFVRTYDFNDGTNELEHFVSEGYELLGIFNWSDHFPGARWLDLQGVRRRCRSLVGEVNVFVGNIIDDHISKRSLHDSQEEEITDEDDFVDVLLGMQGNSKLSNSDMIAVLWEMIFRGTDTVAILLEWILARMILHPDIQAKAQAEIDVIVGESGRQVSDSDLPKLPYLRAIVKETLRMHPPGPRMGSSHHSRDSDWDPLYSRWDHCYGRRVCPGKSMGIATVELWLAQLLGSFKWVPCGEVDLSETLKLSLEMKNPLVC